MSVVLINPYRYGQQFNRTPLKMLKAVPAGFPLPLHDDYFGVVGHSDAIFSNIQSSGEDLRAFTDEAMTIEMPIEIVSITTGSNLIKGFVRVPSALAINDKIYLRTTVGGGESAYSVGDTFGRNNVWQDYNYVVHGSDLTVDVSGNLADGTLTGAASKSGGDLLNGWPCYGFGAREGVASTDRMTVTVPTSSDTETESVVFYKDGTEDNTSGIVVQWDNLDRQLNKQATDEFRWRRKAATTNQSVLGNNTEFTDNAWHYAGGIWPAIGAAPTVRVDGAALTGATVNNGAGARQVPATTLTLANVTTGLGPGDCRIAEFRHRPDNTPDAAWLDLEWDSFNNPGSIAEAEALVVV